MTRLWESFERMKKEGKQQKVRDEFTDEDVITSKATLAEALMVFNYAIILSVMAELEMQYFYLKD